MSTSYNTVQGTIYNGVKGPGGNGMYANCFTKLSLIPNKTVNLPYKLVAGFSYLLARIFIYILIELMLGQQALVELIQTMLIKVFDMILWNLIMTLQGW